MKWKVSVKTVLGTFESSKVDDFYFVEGGRENVSYLKLCLSDETEILFNEDKIISYKTKSVNESDEEVIG